MNTRKLTFAAALVALSCTALSACGDPYVEPLPPRDGMHWPVGLAMHPEGRFLYVVNSNFDTRYREDLGGTVSVIDIERGKILPSNGPFIPSFGGQIVLNADASTAYVAVRSENQILALDVGETGSTISCVDGNGKPSSDVSRCSMQRVPDRDGGALVPSDPFGLDVYTFGATMVTVSDTENGTYGVSLTSNGATTDLRYVSEGDASSSFASGIASTINRSAEYTASADGNVVTITRNDDEPFTIAITPEDDGVAIDDLITISDSNFDILGVSHLRGANVTAISVPPEGITNATMVFGELIAGSNDVKRRPGTLDFYAAGRSSREIAVFRPYLGSSGDMQAIIDRGSVTLNHLTSIVDTRALEFEPDGDTLYAVTRNPDALHIIGLGPSNPEMGTGRLDRVLDSITLDRRPSDIVRHVRADGRVLLYIPCFEAQSVLVVDPALRAIVEEIKLGASPYELVIDRGTRCSAIDGRCRAYVSLFDDLPQAGGSCDENRDQPCGSVGVIELDPDSPRYHRLISKID